ncbi:MAG: sigma-70 family RNA polymerase sigma factor [Anaerolineae bacterium]|nr:sigma-70 family RNA polymerase sigma factor [Anaerolineae bacterium]
MYNTSWSEKLSLYESWYNTDMESLFGYLYYQTQDRDLAQELTASTCLRALERLDQFNPDRGKLKDWIFGIARNLLYDHRRKQSRQPTHIDIAEAAEYLTTNEGFELDYEQRETFLEVLGHVDSLSEREQEIIALRYGAGLSNAEIAPMLKITSNHVAVTLGRAISKLKDKVGAEAHDAS